jgi:uncharacterized membrane protein YedE/YeeE
MKAGATFIYISLGTLFGLVLSRSGAADYNYIQGMFLFEEFQLYGIIGTAVVLTAPGLWLIRRRGRTALGRPLDLELRPFHRGHVAGGLLFGIGWSIAGMCPGPILVNIGEGKLYAVAALAGALTGTTIFGSLYARLQRPMRLPETLVSAEAPSSTGLRGAEAAPWRRS